MGPLGAEYFFYDDDDDLKFLQLFCNFFSEYSVFCGVKTKRWSSSISPYI